MGYVFLTKKNLAGFTLLFSTLLDSSLRYTLYPSLLYSSLLDSTLLFSTLITSSTAQGGGGSFKNRKRIGEIGCCESRMSDQKHWLIVQPSNSLTDYLPNWLIN